MKKVCELVKGWYEATTWAARTHHPSVKVIPLGMGVEPFLPMNSGFTRLGKLSISCPFSPEAHQHS